MEALPRLPMISFDLKTSTDMTEFQKIKEYIEYFYNEDPNAYTSHIHQLEGLRASAIRPAKDASGTALLKRYYCQLHFLTNRFPMDKDGEVAVKVKWKDPYSEASVSAVDITLEMAAILYNIGALHSQIGATANRSTADGLKMACSHFQCGAWAFENVLKEFPQIVGYDTSSDFLTFMNQVCLGQAQECILEKSMMDNRKASNIMKIAVQTAEFYKQALKVLTVTLSEEASITAMGSKWHKKWLRYVKFKIAYYGCIGLLYQGQQAEEQQKMGERVAFYQAAYEKLGESQKLMKNLDNMEAIQETLQFTHDVVEGKKKAATNENEFIYHEQVPAANLLPEVKGAVLVKGMGFNINDPEVSGQDIFVQLVPLSAHQTSSIYSEELAKLQRKMTHMVLRKEDELDSFLETLQMDELSAWDEWHLPQDLIDRCAAFSAKSEAIQNLSDAMNSLSETFQDVENMLSEIRRLLQKEEEAVLDYEQVVGKRPPSIAATDLTREANKYQDAHAKASESNQTLHKAMELHVANLRLLSLPLREIKAHIPIIQLESAEDETAMKDMQHLMNKVKEMKHQRSVFMGQLRDAIKVDDITNLVVTYSGDDKEDLFKQEMSKHQKQINLIKQNLSAQDTILGKVQEIYAKFSNARRSVADKLHQREAMVAGLKASFDAYEDLLAKSNKGLEFYSKLQSNVSKLLQRVRSTCKVQEEEREQVLANILEDVPRGSMSRSKAPDASSVLTIHNNLTDKRNRPSLPDYASSEYTPPVAQSGGLKLKDYLNMKKETGKMSLVDSSSAGPVYGASGYTQSPSPHLYDSSGSWVPGIRPAPVGSEENEPAVPRQIDPDVISNWYGTPQWKGADNIEIASPYAQQYASQPNPSYQSYNTPQSNYPNSVQISYSSAYGSKDAYANQYTNYPTQSSIPYVGPPAQSYAAPDHREVHIDGQSVSPYSSLPPAYTQSGISQYPDNINVSSDTGPVYAAGNYVMQGASGSQTNQNAANSVQPVQPTFPTSTPQPAGNPIPLVSNYQYNTQASNMSYGSQAGLSGPPPANYTNNPGVHGNSSFHPQATASPAIRTTYSVASSGSGALSYASQVAGSSIPPSPNYPVPNMAPYDPNTGVYSSSEYTNPASQMAGYQPAVAPNSQIATGSYPAPLSDQNRPTMSPTISIPTVTSNQQISTSNVPTAQNISMSYTQGPPNSEIVTMEQKPTTVQEPPSFIVSHLSVDYGRSYAPSNQSGVVVPQNNAYTYSQTSGVVPEPGYIVPTSVNDPYKSVAATMLGGNVPLQNSGAASSSQPCDASTYSQNGIAFRGVGASELYSRQYVPPMSNGDYKQAPEYLQFGNISLYTQTSQALDYSMTTSGIYNDNKSDYTTQNAYVAQGVSGSVDESRPQHVGNASTQSPATYGQAGKIKKASTTTTNSSDCSMTSPMENISNLDLLSELDFNISQSPLKPNIPIKQVVNNPMTVVTPQQDLPKNQGQSNETSAVVLVKKGTEEKKLDVESLKAYVPEVEKFEKFVEGLTLKTLNGPTALDLKWKDISDLQEKDSQAKSISVARCYPMKNRFPDILPYDNSRVELPSTKDDYINASFMESLGAGVLPLILTQSPLPGTYVDFWTMVMEQQVEVVVCLLADVELEGHIYWPLEKGQELQLGVLRLSLQSCNVRSHWVERILSLTASDTKVTRVIVHLQFTSWPGSSFPASPAPFLMFAQEVNTYVQQQRNLNHPAVVHCLSGVGRSGLFCLTLAAMQFIQSGRGIPDLVLLAAHMSRCRKNSLRDREHLKFAYQAVLYYSQDLLMKNGILTAGCTFDESKSSKGKCHTRHPSEDFLIPSDAEQQSIKMEAASSDDKMVNVSSKMSVPERSLDSTSTNPLLAAMDPNAFSLSANDIKPPRGKQKFTPDKFTISSNNLNLASGASDTDPLSSLDPLWTMKK